MPFTRDRTKPSPYPPLPFHALRTAQLLSSLVVSSILFYFLRELARDNFRLPWTFILLLAVSLATLLTLFSTTALHTFYGLNTALNTVLNSFLALLWAVAFSLLSWWSAGTLAHVCSAETWDSDTGVAVCRLYKALFSFSLVGFVATAGALGLDVVVRRREGGRGRWVAIGMERKREEERNLSEGGRQRGEGYEVPGEQFEDETGYHGAGGQVGRRSVEGRI